MGDNELLKSKNKLPIRWKTISLENLVLKIFAGGDKPDEVSNEKTEKFKYPIFANGIKNKGLYGYTNIYRVDKECVTISARGTIGYTEVRDEKFVPIVRLIVIMPTKYSLSKYLKYFFENTIVTKSGSSIPQLTVPMIKTIPIQLPPLNEQKRIVTKIEKLCSNLDNSDKYLTHLEKQLKRYRQSVLKSAFEGELTREWREKQTDLESAKELLEKIKDERLEYIEQEVRNKFEDKTEKWIADKVKKEVDKFYSGLKAIENIEKPFAIPKKWEWIQWEQILKYGNDSFKRGPFGSALKKAFFVKDNTYKVYEQYCPINDDCSFERYYISEDKFTELKSFEVKEKDYLISCSGSIGKITQIPKEYKNGVINQALLRVRINDSSYLDKFFITLFRSSFFQDNITDSSTGSAMINLKGVKELKALPLPMLSIAEQNEIVKQIEKHFSIIDKLDSVVQNSIKESKRLRQSILKQAFEGKLVEQDPNDESAEILLEKIAKAKEEYKKEMSKRKKKQ